jgi:Melibiase/Glycosyl hydrolase family 36 C-terminal domain
MRIGSAAALVLGFSSIIPVAAQNANPATAVLSTHDTTLAVEAGAHAPRLASLHGRDGWRLENAAVEALPTQVEVGGSTRALTWHLERSSHAHSRELALTYLSDPPVLRAISHWQARAEFGPIEHSLELRNLADDTLWLPLQPSLSFDWKVDPSVQLERLWIEKGADTPSADGTHLDSLHEGDRWSGSSSTYARPVAGQPREMIPWVLVGEPDGERRGWYLGIEFSGRTRIALERDATGLRGEAGLNPLPGPYRTRLPPGGTFLTPTIFIGAFSGGPDGAGNILRRWVRDVLGHAETLRDPSYPLLVSNSWGTGMAVDESLARRMIEDASALGFEMFHLDAGWFRGVGDWRPDPAKFPHGIAAIADYAHAHHLRFGLWVSWAQAGTSNEPGALNVRDPMMRDWLIADAPLDWKAPEPFKGITVDLGVPGAEAWAGRELERIIAEYHLDMLEHDGYLVAQGSSRTDHPAAPPDPGTLRVGTDSGYLWVDASNSTDVSDYATRAYYRIYTELRRRHPKLLLELCNDGGRMVDFGSAAHGDYFSATDTYDPLANRRAFFDASHLLPPAMLESYVAQWPAATLDRFRYMLRSGMLGWFSLMLDTSHWDAAQRAAARRELALYRTVLRPLIRSADLYHVAERPDGVHWDGIEYYSGKLGRGVLYAFRGSAPGEPMHRFRLEGLAPRSHYRLRFQDGGPAADRTATGEALMREGVPVSLAAATSSELVLIERQD